MTEDVQTIDDETRAVFARMGLTPEEVVAQLDRSRGRKRNRDKRICVCGHSVSKHVDWSGGTACQPSSMSCPCELLIPVIEAEDVRRFLWKTVGHGADHALMRGMGSSVEAGKWVRPIEGKWLCGKCSATDVELTACAITRMMQVSRGPEKINALLCAACIDEVGVVS